MARNQEQVGFFMKVQWLVRMLAMIVMMYVKLPKKKIRIHVTRLEWRVKLYGCLNIWLLSSSHGELFTLKRAIHLTRAMSAKGYTLGTPFP